MNLSSKNPSAAITMSAGCKTDETNMGEYSVAASKPTTLALMPQISPDIFGLFAS